MVHLEGEKTYSIPHEQLFARLTDLQFLVKCLPDLHEVKGVEGARRGRSCVPASPSRAATCR